VNAARVLKWWYFRETITSRMQAADLFYQFDALGRLNDANNPKQKLKPTELYVEPGVLWWAFEPDSAPNRGGAPLPERQQATNRGLLPDGAGTAASLHAVVLLDEIDKADPDVPNDLLEAFDSRRFPVRETGAAVQASLDRRVLLMLTTNGERELPPAFLRRCVTLTLPPPSAEFFSLVANARYGVADSKRHEAIANEVIKAREDARKRNMRMPSTAEFLDAVQACRELDVDTASDAWQAITGSVLLKTDRI
jgi:MoxR-like ATPase